MQEIEVINYDEEEQENNIQNISGIGGWLVVLLIYICISLAGAIYKSVGSFALGIISLQAIISIILIVVYIIMIVVFAMKRYYFVKLATMTFALISCYNIVVLIIAMIGTAAMYSRMYLSSIILVFLVPIIDIAIMILWIVYISKSDRVFNTFRINEEYHHTY